MSAAPLDIEDPIERRARELAEQVRVAAPYDQDDLADLAQLVDQLGPGPA